MANLPASLDQSRKAASAPKASVLLVDDTPANLLSLRVLLEDLGAKLVEAHSGEEALELVQTNDFAVVLLDVQMPTLSGFETAKLIRGRDRLRHTPIIFMTAKDIDRPQLEEAYALGAVDVLVKPLLPIVVQAKVREFVEIFEDKNRAKREADQLRLLVEGAKDYAIFLLDPQGHVASWNTGAERIKQYRADEIIGQHFSRFYPQEAIDRNWPAYELQTAQSEGRFEDEGLRVRKDGSQFWANVVITALRDNSGNLRGFSKITRDVTERKNAEEAARRLLQEEAARKAAQEQEEKVRRSEQELAEFFENATIGLHWVGPDGTILRANRADLAMLGYRREEYVGRPVAEFHVDAAAIYELLRRLSAGEKLVEYAAQLRCKDGSIKDVLIDSSVLWRDGQFVHTRCFTRDVTARKRAEEALRESERLYRAIGESIDYGVWLCDPNGRNIHASDSFLRLVGLTQEQCSAFGWGDVLHPDDAERTLVAWKKCVRTGEQWDIEHRFRGVDGRWHPVLARGVPVRNDRGEITAWAGINLDISRLKQVEDELREADRRKDEFLATLAHELRNPLAPIRNSLQILKLPRVDAETIERSRDMMERQVHHLVRLVDDLMDVSRVMRGKIELRREQVELASVVARAVESAQPHMDAHGHALSIHLPSESLSVDADPIRLAQVIGNLLTNAIKYTDPNGRITLTAGRDGDSAVLCVQDNGIGIAPNMLPHIFELFVQADHASTKAQGGLGIGLTLVKNLVEMHQGTVSARSDGLGKGSEFIVRLPIAAPTIDQDGEIGQPVRQQPAPSGRRLLVVDDNQDAAISLAILLRLQGHEVRVVNDGPSALTLAASFRPDLVILDLGMPGMDGYEVARRIRRMPGLEKMKLVALTGWGQEEDRRRSAAAGFDHHLVKPLEPSVLDELLTELNGSAHLKSASKLD